MKKMRGLFRQCSYRLGIRLLVVTLMSACLPLLVIAGENDDILQKLQKARPDFKFEALKATPAKGIYQTNIIGGPTIYITEDGKHFFSGDFFEVGEDDIVNLANLELERERKDLLAAVELNDMIVFKANGQAKKHIYVFTDVDCYYCQKLHQEMAELNEMGIEVRYLAYPRAGIGSPSYRKIASAWCADNPNGALTQLKSGKNIPDNVCDSNPIEAQFDLGGRLGVRGTPAIITEDGQLLAGYLPAKQLAKALKL